MSVRTPAKHQDIAAEIRREIASGTYDPNGRLPSDAKLMARFGVSRPTVAQAMRTLSLEGLVFRKPGSGTYLRPSTAAPAPITSRRLALLMPNFGHTEVFQLIAGHLASFARHHGYDLVWGGSTQPRLEDDTRIEHGENLCGQFIESRVDGVFFSPYEFIKGGAQANLRIVKRLRDAGIPVVLVDHDLVPDPETGDFDLVGVDNIAGGFAIGRHLLKLGCTRFVHIARPLSAPTIDARFTGIWKAINQFGDSKTVLKAERGDAADPVFANKLMAARPDAIVCGNDHTAALLIRSLARLGVSVPRDVRVTGFDDAGFADLVSPPLTTYRQPCQEIAIAAFRAMLDRTQEPSLPPRNIRLRGALVVRESCGAYVR